MTESTVTYAFRLCLLMSLWLGSMGALTSVRFVAVLLALMIGYAAWKHRERGADGFLIGDCPYYAATAESLANDGDWDLRNQLPGDLRDHEGFFALAKDERIVPKHSTLLPILSLPFYVVFGKVGFLLFNVFQVFLLVCGIQALAGGGAGARWLALAGYLSTPLLAYTYNYSPDVLGTLLVVWAFLFAACLPNESDPRRADEQSSRAGSRARLDTRPILAGLFAGLAIWAKIYLVLVLAPLAILILPMGWRKTLLCVGAAAIAVTPMLVINSHLFGAPWVTGYDRDARLTETGFAITEHYSRFNQPILAGLRNLLLDSRIGILRTAPLWFLWPAGVWYTLRADRSRPALRYAVALTAALLVNLLVFARYDEWDASAFGNRFLFPALAIGLALQGRLWAKFCVASRSSG